MQDINSLNSAEINASNIDEYKAKLASIQEELNKFKSVNATVNTAEAEAKLQEFSAKIEAVGE